MAQRRMFSKEITNSSSFQMMSPSAQSLYFHIGMNADDDGFCEIFTVVRMTESKPDDLRSLHERNFIYIVDNHVAIVKDWHENNYIQADRYTQSKYLENEKFSSIYKTIMVEKTKHLQRYDKINSQCIQDVSKVDTQVRLGKVRLGKDKEYIAEVNSAQESFSLKDEIQKMESSIRRDINIIALYLEKKKPQILNHKQLQVAIKRHLRPAKDLVPFTDTQIIDAIPRAEKATKEWTLETLVKVLVK